MILKRIVHDLHEASISIETDMGTLHLRGVQASHVLNSAPWGKSKFCKELRVVRGDDVAVVVLFMESRDVITIAAEQVEIPESLGDQYPKPRG